MVKILVIYDSMTGNTEKMADAVVAGAKNVKGAQVVLRPVGKATHEDLLGSDGIIIGSPTYYGQMSGKLKTFIDTTFSIHGKLRGKVGGAFTSAGGIACGAETTILSILNAMLVHGMVVQGRPDDKHYGPTAVEAPDKDSLENCRELGERVAALATKLKA